MSTLEVLFCALLVALAAFFSAAEISLFSLSRFQLRSIRDHFPLRHKKIKRLLSDPSGLLLTVLLSNEVLNVGISTLIAENIAEDWVGRDQWLLSMLPGSFVDNTPEWVLQTAFGLLITTPTVLIFCEATPKVIAARMNQVIAILSVAPMSWVYTAMKPLRVAVQFVLNYITRRLSRSGSPAPTPEEPKLQEEEFLQILEEGHKEGMIHQTEIDLIRNIFHLDDRKVSEVCTPIGQVNGLSSNLKLSDAMILLQRKHHYRLPVFGTSKREIVGVLYSKDILTAKLDPSSLQATVGDIMRRPFYVNEKAHLNKLFRLLKQEQTHLAVVVDDKGEAIGIVTMHDVLEEIFVDVFPEEKRA